MPVCIMKKSSATRNRPGIQIEEKKGGFNFMIILRKHKLCMYSFDITGSVIFKYRSERIIAPGRAACFLVKRGRIPPSHGKNK